MAMEKSRYKRSSVSEEVAKPKDEPAKVSKTVVTTESESKSEPAPVRINPSKEQVRAMNGGVWMSREAAEKLRLAMLQIADIFGNCELEPEKEPEKEPEPKKEPEPAPKSQPGPTEKYSPRHVLGETDRAPVEEGPKFVFHRDYDFAWQYRDAATGKIAYSDGEDIWSALAYAADPSKIQRLPVWLKDGKVIRPMTSAEAKIYLPHLFL